MHRTGGLTLPGWRSARRAAVALGVGLASGGLAFALLGLASALGVNIPTPDIQADYTKGVVWAMVLAATIVAWPVRRDEKVLLLGLWAVRSAVTLGAMLVYERAYPVLDTYGYFSDALDPALGLTALEIGSGTGFIKLLTWLHVHWLVASFHATKVSFAMFGFVGVYVFYCAACRAAGRRDPRVLLALSFCPSILFWSSILGKDPIVFFGLALYALGTVAWMRGGGGQWLVTAAVGVLVAMAIRIWLGPICVAPLLLNGMRSLRSWWQRALLLVAGAAALAGLLVALRNFFAVQSLADSLQLVGRVSSSWSADGSSGASAIPDLSNPLVLVAFLPLGMFTALFRPLPGEIMNAFGLLAGVEGLALVALAVLALARLRLRDFGDPVVASAAAFVVTWAVVYAPISFQNLGSAVRFRLQVLPLLLLLLLHLARKRQPAGAGPGEFAPAASG